METAPVDNSVPVGPTTAVSDVEFGTVQRH